MEESVDLEHHQLLLSRGDRSGSDGERWSYSSPARTLAFVVLTVGLAFAVRLLARDDRTLFTAFAAQLVGFFLFTSLVALCAAPWGRGACLRPWAGAAAARVLFWSFAMAVVVSMTCWAAAAVSPVAVGVALCLLGAAVVFACFAELVHSLFS